MRMASSAAARPPRAKLSTLYSLRRRQLARGDHLKQVARTGATGRHQECPNVAIQHARPARAARSCTEAVRRPFLSALQGAYVLLRSVSVDPQMMSSLRNNPQGTIIQGATKSTHSTLFDNPHVTKSTSTNVWYDPSGSKSTWYTSPTRSTESPILIHHRYFSHGLGQPDHTFPNVVKYGLSMVMYGYGYSTSFHIR